MADTCRMVKGEQVLVDGRIQPACIYINSEGFITSVVTGNDTNDSENLQTDNVIIADPDQVIMPGIVDAHVHVNEPGRTDWEGFSSATQAAAAGGITTIVDMPLNCSPVTTTLSALEEKLPHATRQSHVNIAFWGGIVPNSQVEILPMIKKGVRGFKCFLIHSGIDEFPHCEEPDLREAYRQLEGTDSVFLFHAEKECDPAVTQPELLNTKYETFLQSRPEEMEIEAIKLVISLCKEYKVRSHIVHLSAASALPLIREAQKSGVPLTVETCHHYLTLTSESIPDGATEYKCCPPIRDSNNQKKLWEALLDGSISMVVSDHSPCTANLKLPDEGDFMAAWGGISGLQFGLSLFWTSCSRQGFSLAQLSLLMSHNTARHARLESRVGEIRAGLRADLVIWSPEQRFTVTLDKLYHKNKLTPYMGMELKGVVHTTIIGGKVAYSYEGGFSKDHYGILLM